MRRAVGAERRPRRDRPERLGLRLSPVVAPVRGEQVDGVGDGRRTGGGGRVGDVEEVAVDDVAVDGRGAAVRRERVVVVAADAEPRVRDRRADRGDHRRVQRGLQRRDLAAHRARRVHQEVDVRGADADAEDQRVERGRAERQHVEEAALEARHRGVGRLRVVGVRDAVAVGVGERRHADGAREGEPAGDGRVDDAAGPDVGRAGSVGGRIAARVARVADDWPGDQRGGGAAVERPGELVGREPEARRPGVVATEARARRAHRAPADVDRVEVAGRLGDRAVARAVRVGRGAAAALVGARGVGVVAVEARRAARTEAVAVAVRAWQRHARVRGGRVRPALGVTGRGAGNQRRRREQGEPVRTHLSLAGTSDCNRWAEPKTVKLPYELAV